MITRPAWERPLRRRLREKRQKRGRVPGWLKDQAGVIVIALILQVLLPMTAASMLGPGGGGTGTGILAGLVGALFGIGLRANWHSHRWLIEWTPATRSVVRRLQTREFLSVIIFPATVVLVLSMAGALASPAIGFGEVLAAAVVAMASGFLLCGGRVSMFILLASIVWTVGYCIVSPWLLDETAELATRVVKGAVLGWLPAMPWALCFHGAPQGGVQGVLLGVALVISLREWWHSWQEPTAAPAQSTLAGPVEMPDDVETSNAGEIGQSKPADEEQRTNIRQQVAFAWFGMAGYLPDRPMPWIDRLIWRWLTPRQRLISTLGSHDAFGWCAQTRWTALFLMLMSVLAWLPRWTRDHPGFDDWNRHLGFWYFVASLALAALVLISGWPSRRSRFQPWLELMEGPGIGHFPALALLPIGPGEWLRGVVKEWFVRAAWISLLCTLAILAGFPELLTGGALPWTIGLTATPWLLFAVLFPLSVMNRLFHAVAGPNTRTYGLSLTLPALLSAVLGMVPAASAVLALGTGNHLFGLLSALIAVVMGGFSVWMTLLRCKSMRLDIKPKQLG
jgi:hypothetical protein